MNIRDRLMGRASVAVMAAFAPKKDGDGADHSKVGQAENVDAGGDAGGSDDGDLGGLSAEEQAQFDAMTSGAAPGGEGNVEHAGAAGDDGEAGAGEAGDDNDEEDAGDDDTTARSDEDGAAGDQAAEESKNKRISLGKHKREVEKLRKQIADREAEIEKGRTERVRLDERTRMLLEAITAKPKDAAAADGKDGAKKEDDDPEPDKDQDPIGHLQWKVRKQDAELAALKSGRAQDQEQTQAEREAAALYGAYEEDLTAANSADQSVGEAFVHYRESRYKELGWHFADIDITDEAQTSRLTDEQQAQLSQAIKATFHREQMQMAEREIKAGRRPSRKIVELARARGFAPKTAEQRAAEAAAAGGQGNGSAGGKAPAKAAPQGSVKDQLQSIREGQQAAKSLSDAGGSQGNEMTPERLAGMSDDEFEAFFNQTSKGRFDKIMGKPAVS